MTGRDLTETLVTTLIFRNLQQKYSVLPLADLNSCRLKYFNLEDKNIANLAISKRSVISEIKIRDVQEQHLQFPHNSIPYCSTCFSPLNKLLFTNASHFSFILSLEFFLITDNHIRNRKSKCICKIWWRGDKFC